MPQINDSQTTVKAKRWYQLSFGDILKVCSTALVPLMIGVMTLVTTLQQNRLARENRLQDLHIAQATRQDLILSTYLNEMSRLMIDFNFTLNKQVRSVVVRPKTLTALNQLIPSRKILLLEFLYESNLIRGRHNVFERYTTDLREADLKQVNFNPNGYVNRPLSYVWLVGTHLDKAKFEQCDLSHADFTSANMVGASFRKSQLKDANFYRSSLINTDFTDTLVNMVDFTFANLTGSNIKDKQLKSSLTYHRAILPNGTRALYMNLLLNGDAQQCNLHHWDSEINGTIEIRVQDRNCYFAANRSQGEVIMHQKINYEKLRATRSKEYFIEARIDIRAIHLVNQTSRVHLSKLFLDEKGFVLAQDECSINMNDLSVDKYQTKSWVTENWSALRQAYWIELYITFSHSIVCDNIGLFLEEERIFEEDQLEMMDSCTFFDEKTILKIKEEN